MLIDSQGYYGDPYIKCKETVLVNRFSLICFGAAMIMSLLAQPPWKGLQAKKLDFRAVIKSAANAASLRQLGERQDDASDATPQAVVKAAPAAT